MREYQSKSVSGEEARERFGRLSPEEKQRSNYFRSFAISHKSAFEPHVKKGETLGHDTRREGWINVSEHCLVEGVLTDVLSELLHLSPEDRTAVVTAALMHDWDKKREVHALRADRQRGDQSLEEYEKAKTEGKDDLKKLGVPESVLQLTDAMSPKTRSGPSALTEKIVWYADAIVSQTEIVRLRERMNDTERGWDGHKEDPVRAAQYKKLGESSRARPGYGGLTVFDVQREIADRVEPELAKLAGFNGPPEDFPQFLKEKIQERIKASS